MSHLLCYFLFDTCHTRIPQIALHFYLHFHSHLITPGLIAVPSSLPFFFLLLSSLHRRCSIPMTSPDRDAALSTADFVSPLFGASGARTQSRINGFRLFKQTVHRERLVLCLGPLLCSRKNVHFV